MKYWLIALLLTSCNSSGQSNFADSKVNSNDKESITTDSLNFKKGITSIFEDSKGNFWFGSKEEGVCKFDGKSYQHFSVSDGLPHLSISNIQEDVKGNIWLNTGKGICYYDGTKFTSVSREKELNSIQNTGIQPLHSPSEWYLNKESLWFPIYNDGILRYDQGKMDYLAIPIPKKDVSYDKDRIDQPYHYPYSAITIYQDNNKKLWIGTFNRGIVGYDGKAFEYHNPNNFGVGTIRSIFQDKDGNYWFGSNGGGLYKYDGEKYINFTKEKGLTSSNPGYGELGTLSQVWSIEQDNEGNMWFGAADSGLWKYDGKELTNYSMKDGLPSNFVETIYKDNKGDLWFCSGRSSNGILYKFNGEKVEIIN